MNFAPIRYCLLVSAAALLSACVSRDYNALPQSSGTVQNGERLVAVKAMLVRPAALPVKISKLGYGSANEMTGLEKSTAESDAKALSDAFTLAFNTGFAACAAKYGLMIKQDDPALPTLQLTVVGSDMLCSGHSCVSMLVIDSDVFSASGQFVWHMQTSWLTAPAGAGKSNMAAIDDYARKLFETMKRDKLLPE